mmetsp:Transcript_30816/g.68267  ORF Transcript_30816/g.68267 Transcript_30816/m.68267 type:complete len:306 (+) Transcript_30816:120-1037(+)|eukprot:CAMPEP_0202901250 /NCGR_PEP_ID=MMETSP1392-20130828/14148_1 /ASSEMBLY_ACC=CAM_ASM_000868 /TAXON_ID=225041 /ORGANISM="Chlamydomonas chlamydogama, Strain SAG 11-48b" /LENGTH=305 /DNA_ID=CAMNT_0049587787 /DNA_START=79 /DNA_END=996 /DNA_ORIENTATION=-
MGAGLSSTKQPDLPPEYELEIQLTVQVAVEEVISAAQAAGKAILDIYSSEVSKWDVELKSDNSPLTRADKEANKVICAALQRITPHIPIVTEEAAVPPYSVRQKFQYYWLVDPLDGTKEFLKRNGEFTVNIALVQKDVPVLGVVHVPCQGKTYWAVKDKGAWLRQAKGQQERIKCAEFSIEDAGLRIVASSSHQSKETEEFVSLFKTPEFMQVGSSLKLLMVAEGAAHIYPRMAPCCEWDTAAADIIVREAGGVVLQAGLCDGNGKGLEDWKTALMKEQPLIYNKENILNPFFVVFGSRKQAAAK